ncbi:DUF975 family protein [Candidatus Clostridium radicumherbarum]|uniref:DUF975 family protein n=1 Tax=Candidatus Clostridium radicumherbarum TaxID=3381662 RepID=A0ABW8TWL4_9CLOT
MYEGGLRENYEYRAEARRQLKGKWGMAVLVILISWLIIRAFSSNGFLSYSYVNGQFVREYSNVNSFASLVSLILSGPIAYGVATYFMKVARNGEPLLEDMFGGFKYFINTFLVNLVTGILTILWTLLFIIPGIVAALRYSMAYYIMNDNPGITCMEAINQSKEMMRGHKGKLFLLTLSFIGWALLSILTLGIGLLWVGAYYNTAKINFYEDLKRINGANNYTETV